MEVPADVWTSVVANMHPEHRAAGMANLFASANDPSNILQGLDTYFDMQQARHNYPGPNPYGIPLQQTCPQLAAALSTQAHAVSHLANTDVLNCCVEHTTVAMLETPRVRTSLTELAQDVSDDLYEQMMRAGVDPFDAGRVFEEPVHIEVYAQFTADQGTGVTPVSRYLYNISAVISQSSDAWYPDASFSTSQSVYIPRHPLNLMADVRTMMQQTNFCVLAAFDTIPDQGADMYDSSTLEVHYVSCNVANSVRDTWAQGTRRQLMF